MGSTIHDVYVRGVSAMSCRLTKFPVLLYTDPATGALRPVPVVGPTGPQQPVLLQPGGWVEFATRWRNYPADGSDPRCTRAVSYHGLWVELAGGLRYSLGTWTATTTCDDFQETGWRASGPPQPTS